MTTEPVLTYRVNRVCQVLGVSRATTYRLVRDKKLELVKVGKRASGITAESLQRHLAASKHQNEG